ncbi:hypothetical protein [Streptomyces gilvus]|uniref:hypothetical protein n=1 Tax=Streptomyces gilvus TaxID=2920937 RepID=UPI001F0FFA8F|nr:hypothetical protein [Streptomyces sp. CME 23]MCH5676192.1 hypothetical protein [Streptomyces sp. CME 23]
MKRMRHQPASLGLADAVHVVPAQRHATDLLLATGQDHRHAAPPVGSPYFRAMPYGLDG